MANFEIDQEQFKADMEFLSECIRNDDRDAIVAWMNRDNEKRAAEAAARIRKEFKLSDIEFFTA